MTPTTLAIILGAFPVVLATLFARIEGQRKDTGKRIGNLESRLDKFDGYREGYEAGVRDTEKRLRGADVK